jgi:phosphoribosylglycinamide formyltransferase-1
VLASGGGTNCQALLDAATAGELNADIVAVITNNAGAGVVGRAERAGVPLVIVDHRGGDPETRAAADARLIETISAYRPDVVVLAGWMRILGDAVGSTFRIINLHPALPGAFPGVGAIERAFAAWERGEIVESGVMIHWVPDAGVDVGPVIISETVRFMARETFDDFAARMHQTEHRLIVAGAQAALESL